MSLFILKKRDPSVFTVEEVTAKDCNIDID
jgi:hypothetical protein